MLFSIRSHRPLTLALLGVLLSSLAQAQDLATLAKKEKERRAKVTRPVKVLTEDDGKEAGAKGTGSVTALPGEATTPPGGGVEKQAESDSPENQQAKWKKRGDAARAAVANAEKTLAQMERDLAALRSDMTQVSAADAQDPMRLQKRDARVFAMNKQIEGQKAAIVATKKALADFEDEARRSGVPAGWLR